MRLNLNLNRSYNSLKLFRTYIGGSKKKELRTFWDAQGYAKDEVYVKGKDYDNHIIDWFECRRLTIISFEDIIHVRYSRMIFIKRLSYILLGLAFILLLFKISLLICVGTAIFSIFSSQYFKEKLSIDVSNYGVVMAFTDNYIQKEFGIILPEIN